MEDNTGGVYLGISPSLRHVIGWEDSGQECPRCGKNTEFLVERSREGIEYDLAERCLDCEWTIYFGGIDD